MLPNSTDVKNSSADRAQDAPRFWSSTDLWRENRRVNRVPKTPNLAAGEPARSWPPVPVQLATRERGRHSAFDGWRRPLRRDTSSDAPQPSNISIGGRVLHGAHLVCGKQQLRMTAALDFSLDRLASERC